MSCPSCDRDLTYPGQPGHACYTYEQWAENQRGSKRPLNADDGVS